MVCCFSSGRSNKRSIVFLIAGLVIGFFLAELFLYSTNCKPGACLTYYEHYVGNNIRHSSELAEQGHENVSENNSVAAELFSKVRILCWIMTTPENHQTKAIHVHRTWGRRCNKLIFMSTTMDKELDTVVLPIAEGRNRLWGKTKAAFKYIYEKHINDADWFFKADDDTYTIVENLRFMLYPYNPETPVYFGCKFKPFVKQGYMSGGAGYVLSREAVRRFVREGLPNPQMCQEHDEGEEDVELGLCLENVNVLAGDSRDSIGRGRFFPFEPEEHLLPPQHEKNYWYWNYIYYKTDEVSSYCLLLKQNNGRSNLSIGS